MAKSFPTKTRRAGRFFGSQSRRSKAPRKGRIAGQLSTVGYPSHRCVSISQTRQTLLAPWLFQIHQRRRCRANGANDALPLPLRLNLYRLPEDRSRGSGRATFRSSHEPVATGLWPIQFGRRAISSARRLLFTKGACAMAALPQDGSQAVATSIGFKSVE